MDAPVLEQTSPTLSEAQEWIARIKAPAILSLLKDPDHAMNVSRAFFGYRPDAKSYANTLVRTRLAQAAVKDSLFAKKIRALSEIALPPQVKEPQAVSPVEAKLAAASRPDKSEALRAERNQLRRERDESRQALALAQSALEEAVKARLKAEQERDDAQRQSKTQTDRITRLERQKLRQQEMEAQLVRALNQDKVSPPRSASGRANRAASVETEAADSPWLLAVQHLLNKGKYDQAIVLAEDVLQSEPDDADALAIAASGWEGRREMAQAAQFLRRLLVGQISRREMVPGAETLAKILSVVSEPGAVEPDARRYLAALPASDTRAVEGVKKLLARLRGTDPAAHGWLTTLIATQTPLAPILMPPPGALGTDDILPLKLGMPLTARRLVDAVDRGEAPLIDTARDALLALKNSDPETHGRIWLALEQATSDDLSRLTPLRRAPRGPIVVDGSNVAWFDQESLTQGKPRLRHLWEMRRALRERGYFPVLLYADANLPYFIDDPVALRLMQGRGELMRVDAGTAADEVLLRMAKHLNASLVTNDKMEDWDPEGEVPKIRYTISLGGEAHFLTDI